MTVKTSLFAAFLAAFSPAIAFAADAKWVEGASSSGGALYYDASSMKSDGQFVTIMALNDFKEPAQDGKLVFRSMISRQLVNCANNVVATNYIAYHAGNMGQGDLVYSSDTIRETQRAAPGTLLGRLVEALCN